ncbi:hypothetical protein ABB37_04735 [Leptomonas pyrrhocoris]|uniref:Uncharacterized protein n=1 Tax=Leptomonas pyrrhocoris TaxID=157538 RepID=A0A0N0VFE8_LEPPY|nr:hypothetical protein ABB37_04735 [Leptomonas pyrrhocoris]XP_015658964.1 hypothetical protein ABB37_04735 [Leptomonas pyrrhocoris]KPA80524.1 hypothetical protein ABB37_04735 [Leptomonas pyrrhocoris]KPA80525.1 hypothetical protein ABB37_04735 [Leptomonas pyrrhocoris]|eukprot:XP_015658963.1 hypothetical protein ABB37_04735 [Leptomonas pyrrhocoris]
MTAMADDEVLPMRAALRAKDVVAAGQVENVLQLPSPVYTAEFTDAHHVLIGAGGGGKKFGMANVALLLRVASLRGASSSSSSPSTSSAASIVKSGVETAAAASPSSAAPSEPPVWGFAAAIDLGEDIPWCTSAFLPFNINGTPPGGSVSDPAALRWSDQQRVVLQGLVGFIALSSITAFTLIGVYRGTEPTSSSAMSSSEEEEAGADASAPAPPTHQAKDKSDCAEPQRRYLRQLARITVPHDAKDPDKKPIALSQNVLLVAHDANGVLGYALTDLVPHSFEDNHSEAYERTYASQVKASGGALQRRVPHTVTTAAPVVEWPLPARVNDLSVNRVCIVQAARSDETGPSAVRPCKAHLQEHLILAAVLQDKTVVLSTLRLRQKYVRTTRDAVAPVSVVTALTLTGAELPLPFKLLTSSLRLVRLYGWNNIAAGQQAEMRRQLTWQSLQEHGAPTHGPLCSLLLVAFNTHTSESFLLHGAVDVTPLPSASHENRSALTLQLRWVQPQPTPVLGDAITSLSTCADRVPADDEARIQRSPVGAAVPTHFIVGTVEGWVASVRWIAAEGRWRSDHVRPSPLKSVAKRFPALHKEPVSCVAVSAENDVVSADIAQNVALTTLPYALRPSPTPASSSQKGSAPGSARGTRSRGADSDDALYVVQPRLATSATLFPPSTPVTGLLSWVMRNTAGELMPARALIFLTVPVLLLLVALIIMMR